MSIVNTSGLNAPDFINTVQQQVAQTFANAGLQGKLVYTPVDRNGNTDLGVAVEGTQAECLSGKLSEGKRNRILAIISKLSSDLGDQSMAKRIHAHQFRYYSNPLGPIQQGLLAAFLNRTILVSCPRGMGL